MRRFAPLIALSLIAAAATPVAAQVDELQARATLVNARGDSIGTAFLQETPTQGVLVRLSVTGLPPGPHGFHIHGTGSCEGEGFSGSGGHYAPRGRAHGVLHPEGRHAGDLLNLHVPPSGVLTTERLAGQVTLSPGEASLLDADGSALIVHSDSDDYRSQPSGNGGTPIACGVVRSLETGD